MVPGVTSGDRGNRGWKLLRVTEPCSILWRKLRKDWCRDVELSGNGSVHEFYCMKSLITFEQVNASVKTSIWWWGYKLVGRCKLSLYENESCDEHAVYFWRWLKWGAMFITFLLSSNDLYSYKRILWRKYSLTILNLLNILKNTRLPIKREVKSFSEEILQRVELIASLSVV